MVLTVTRKGQITLNQQLLRHLGVAPGEQIDIDVLPDGTLRLRRPVARGRIEGLFGLLRREHGKVATLEEISEATAAGAAEGVVYERN